MYIVKLISFIFALFRIKKEAVSRLIFHIPAVCKLARRALSRSSSARSLAQRGRRFRSGSLLSGSDSAQLGGELFLRYSRLFSEGPDRRAGGVARSVRVLVEFQTFTLLYPKHD